MKDSKYGKSLFVPYFTQYQKWRDLAIDAAIDSHKKGKDVAFLNLDIKSYFDSIDMDLNIFGEIAGEYKFLNDALIDIHGAYASKRKCTKKILPIGLLSSGVLANYYLKQFDRDVVGKLNPVYYGRYVDDILIVIAKPYISSQTNLVTNFMNKEGICNLVDHNYWLDKFPNLSFQEDKVRAFLIKSTDTASILEGFRRIVRRNSSEFRWLPEEEAVFSTFSESSFKFSHSGSINKLRSIDGFESDKFGASKHLSAILTAVKFLNKIDTDVMQGLRCQLLEYFKGQRNIEFYQLWEKVLSVFVLIGDKEGFAIYVAQIIDDIYRIKYKNKKKLILSLIRYIRISIAMAVSLDNDFYDDAVDVNIKTKICSLSLNYNIYPYISQLRIKIGAKQIFSANMFRHVHTYFPLINLCNNSSNLSLHQYGLQNFTNWDLHPDKIRFYPRFIHLHELIIFYRIRRAFISDSMANVHKIYKEYIKYNRLPRLAGQWHPKAVKSSKNDFFIISQARNLLTYNNVKVAMVNCVVKSGDSFNNLYGDPELTPARYFNLNKLLNDSVRERSSIIVLPEMALPVQWVWFISEFSRKNNIAIVAGLEHFSTHKKEAFNFSLVTLPYKNLSYINCFVDMRLKINYSPAEIKKITSPDAPNGPYYVPEYKQYNEKMRLYNWQGNYFSVFNCYELTDIAKRGMFKGNADFIVVIVHNKDTSYFSSIIESLSRDAHLFVVQVNTSEYGDSRITQPKKTVLRDIAKIKGGKNLSILVEPLEIVKLRSFQSLSLTDQSNAKDEDNPFKPVPPGYNMASFRKLK